MANLAFIGFSFFAAFLQSLIFPDHSSTQKHFGGGIVGLPQLGENQVVFCRFCRTYLVHTRTLMEHYKGKKHRNNALKHYNRADWYEFRSKDELKS